MPALPKIKNPVMRDLSRQLRFANPRTLRKHIGRVEALASELSPERDYPLDWLVFRVTGYRPDAAGADALEQLAALGGSGTLGGGDVLKDLSALVETLCADAGVTFDECIAGGGVEGKALAQRWSISTKTLDRFRRSARDGLIGRRCAGADGRVRIVYMPVPVASFGHSHAGQLASASAFTRLSPTLRARMLRRAARYRRGTRLSLHAVAARLSQRFGRSLEGVRLVLRRSGLFDDPPPITERARRAMERAWRRGALPSALASHFRCGRPAAARAINLVRAQRLVELVKSGSLDTPESAQLARTPTALRDWTLNPALAPSLVCTGLATPGATDLSGFIEDARRRVVIGPRDERTLLLAFQVLRGVARGWIESLTRANPQSVALDHAETALQWAACLKVLLMRTQLHLLVDTAAAVLGADLETLRPSDAASCVRTLLADLAHAIDRGDPGHTSRVASLAGLEMNAACVTWSKSRRALITGDAARRAVSRIAPGVAIPDWTREVAPWQVFLEPDRRIRAVLPRLDPSSARLLELRHAWSGQRPRTLDECAERLDVARVAMPRRERLAIRCALELVRAPRPSRGTT